MGEDVVTLALYWFAQVFLLCVRVAVVHVVVNHSSFVVETNLENPMASEGTKSG